MCGSVTIDGQLVLRRRPDRADGRTGGGTVTAADTVLVVDDSLVIRAVVRGWLEERGYHVVDVPDGAAAIEHCLSAPPDVILLDIEMPGLERPRRSHPAQGRRRR